MTRVTRGNFSRLIKSGALVAGSRVTVDGREYTIRRVDPSLFCGCPIDVGVGCSEWKHLDRDIRVEEPDTSDPSLDAIRSQLRDAITSAAPSTLIPVAEALGFKVRESITYSLVPREGVAKLGGQ